jgi:hypothetical protein
LCSKVNKERHLEYLQDRFAVTVYLFRKTFIPNFFDIMEHLPIHLVEDALLASLVQCRWMFPVEKYLKTLKCYVCNRAHPEGWITNGYIVEECMTFMSRYLDDVEIKENRPLRYVDDDNEISKPIGKGIDIIFDRITLMQAH